MNLTNPLATRITLVADLRETTAPATNAKINFKTRTVPADGTSTALVKRRLRHVAVSWAVLRQAADMGLPDVRLATLKQRYITGRDKSMSGRGPSRKWRDVRLEPEMCKKADTE